mgnify:FL=1
MNIQLNTFLLASLYFIYSALLSNNLLITAVGISFTLYLFLIFLHKIGKELPIKELIVLIAASQWIVGAKIGYNIGKVHYKYYLAKK